MKVWITKYALTKGIFIEDAEICHDISCDMIRTSSGGIYHGNGREWHITKESAIKQAEEMRRKKIKNLRNQIEKLEKISFQD